MTVFTDLTNAQQAEITSTFKAHQRQLYFAAYKVCRDFPEPADAARDIVADAFVKACRGSWGEQSSLYTWLFRAVINGALDHIRRHEQVKRIRGAKGENVAPCADTTGEGANGATAESSWVPSDVTPKGDIGPERHFFRKERRRLVNEALAMCSPREQAVWECCRFDGLSTVGAADVLGLTQPTAYRALSSATDKVRAHVAAMTC